MSTPQPVTFLAAIAPFNSAIAIDGMAGGSVVLDIPEVSAYALKALMDMRQETLVVTIRVQGTDTNQENIGEDEVNLDVFATGIKRWNG